MADNAGDRALAAATQLSKIGYVEFTTQLVRDTYRVIVDASMDQLKTYADFVAKIAKTLEDYQGETIGADDAAKQATADSYIREVLGLTLTGESPSETQELTLSDDQIASLQQHFLGITVTLGEGSAATAQDIAQAIGDDKIITLKDLRLFVIEKLKKHTKDSYDLLKTILKIGMQKVVVSSGEIHTKLTFSVDATDTYSKTSSDFNRKASNWGISGSLSGRFGDVGGSIAGLSFGSYIGGSISGGYGGSKLNVSVVNEQSAAATNISIDILGEVRIQFRTETFPSIEA